MAVRVEDVRLELDQGSQLARVDHFPNSPCGPQAAAVVADLEDDPRPLGGGDGPLAFGHRQGERLFDENVFSGRCRLANHLRVG
ncbi:MAG: hypothetical protein VCF07_07830 [Nitrospinota bacterium]